MQWLQTGHSMLIEEALATVGLDPALMLFGNSIGAYAGALLVFLVGYFVLRLIQWVFLTNLNKIAERTKTEIDDAIIKIVRSFSPPFYAFISFWLALRPLEITGIAEKGINAILIMWVIYQVVIAAGIFVEDVLFKSFAKDRDPNTKSALRLIVSLAKGAMWGLGVILLLSNLGVDVSSLLAGVGIGGIAIAFALQGILADLFSSFSIYFDKPFKVGDFIILDNERGTVENIGIKSTRIRSLTGEQLVVSNQELTQARVHNYADVAERRGVMMIGVLYETSPEKLKQIQKIIEEVVSGVEQCRFDRAHLKSFGESSLDFEVVFHSLSKAHAVFMQVQHDIHVGIFERFGEEGIGFAYPTRTLYMTREENNE